MNIDLFVSALEIHITIDLFPPHGSCTALMNLWVDASLKNSDINNNQVQNQMHWFISDLLSTQTKQDKSFKSNYCMHLALQQHCLSLFTGA
jgi:hypothetical protein